MEGRSRINVIEFVVILCVNDWWLKPKCDKRIIQFVWIGSISLHPRFRFSLYLKKKQFLGKENSIKH